uniref:Uncharacterized protein n=1 Tax=Anopheles maculatus TaxID=74869 RepID=A0A182SVP4_9DIPT
MRFHEQGEANRFGEKCVHQWIEYGVNHRQDTEGVVKIPVSTRVRVTHHLDQQEYPHRQTAHEKHQHQCDDRFEHVNLSSPADVLEAHFFGAFGAPPIGFRRAQNALAITPFNQQKAPSSGRKITTNTITK